MPFLHRDPGSSKPTKPAIMPYLEELKSNGGSDHFSTARVTYRDKVTNANNCEGCGCSCTISEALQWLQHPQPGLEAVGQKFDPAARGRETLGKQHWGIVFPFHGQVGTVRMDIVDITWRSLCRAMARVNSTHVFHIIAMDDSGEIDPNHHLDKDSAAHAQHTEWLRLHRGSCAPNLDTLLRTEGTRQVAMNMKVGFEWAASHEKTHFVMNLDSDMLLIENYFSRMTADYAAAEKSLGCMGNVIISGYASDLWKQAFGANFLFDKETFTSAVKPLSKFDLLLVPILPVSLEQVHPSAVSHGSVRWMRSGKYRAVGTGVGPNPGSRIFR